MTITDFLSLEKPSKDDRIKIDVLNDNTDKIDNHFKRNSIVLTATGKNISVDATGPYYTVTNNTGDSVQVLLEGTMSIILDSGETQKAVKNTAETFTLTVSCASDVTVTYFSKVKDYVDSSLESNLSNYYDKDNSDGRYLQISDFGSARNEESSSVCSEDMPLKYTAYGNDVEQYKVYGKTSQLANPSPGFPKDVHGVGDLVTESEHFGQYAIPIVCNGTTYNVYLDEPLYETNSVRDYIDYARQKVIRKTGVITYDGSTDENWTSIEYQTYGIDVGVQVVDTTDQNYIGHMYCDKLTSSSAVSNFVNKIAITNGKITVHFDSSLTSVELFVAYLQSHPITVYFPLAEAVEEDVVLPDLPTIYGENQLYVDTDILPSIVSVSAALQYFSPREMYESFPSKDDFWTKSESEKYTTAEKNKLASITNPIKLKGRVDSISDLPADAEIGWLYFVGTNETADKEEYVYTEDEAWEHIGTSAVDLSDYYTKSEVDTAISSKADSTTLTTHTGDTNVHVTPGEKTALSLMPKSKAMDFDQNTQVHKDFVIPLICISNTQVNEYFSGRVFLKSTTAAARQMSIINVYCCKNYEEEKPVFFADGFFPFSVSRPCTFTYNSKKWFGLRVYATSDFNITRIDARTTTDLNDIQQIYYYNNYTATVINSEINDSLVYASNDNDVQIDGYNTPLSFFTTPRVLGTKSRPTAYLLTFSPAPATATATGTAGEIAYDSNYIYVCTGTNTWKRVALSSW